MIGCLSLALFTASVATGATGAAADPGAAGDATAPGDASALSAPAACPRLDIDLLGGTVTRPATLGGARESGLAGGLALGGDLQGCVSFPLRLEVSGMITQRGARHGTDAVGVSADAYHVGAAAGVAWAPFELGHWSVGMEALAGPDLRIDRVATNVRDIADDTVATRVGLQLAAGVWGRYKRVRFDLRGWTALFDSGERMLMGAVGYTW